VRKLNSIAEACYTLEQIEQAQGSNAKKDILSKASPEAMQFLMTTALNPYLNYGISEVDEHSNPREDVPSLEELKLVRDELAAREITGNAARELLSETLTTKDPIVRKWLFKVFQKNLRAGMSTGTVNKVWPKLIPEFEIALCDSLDDESGKLPDGKWCISPKIDGMRCIAFVDGAGDVNFVSRGFKPLYNLESIGEEIKQMGFTNCVIDGEIIASGTWEGTAKVVRASKSERDTKELKYLVFDYMHTEQWISRNTPRFEIRYETMLKVFDKPGKIEVLEHKSVSSLEEAMKIHEEYLDKGLEGSVLKELNAMYPFDRSEFWLKWKPVATWDVTIIGYEEGKGKLKGMLGYFICNLNGVQTHVGGGFKEEERKDFWSKRDEMIGKIIEVEGFKHLTPDGRIRFPQFMRVREDLS